MLLKYYSTQSRCGGDLPKNRHVTMEQMIDRLVHQMWPALTLGLISIIAGGLLAAITAHAATQSASWASAYLVLVLGVGTAGLSIGRGLLSPGLPSPRRLGTEFALWVGGNALVLAGTLGGPALLVDVGSAALVVSLASVLAGVVRGRGSRTLRSLFLTLVIVLLVSIPVGIVLSHLRR